MRRYRGRTKIGSERIYSPRYFLEKKTVAQDMKGIRRNRKVKRYKSGNTGGLDPLYLVSCIPLAVG
jgi:hypothetical protein